MEKVTFNYDYTTDMLDIVTRAAKDARNLDNGTFSRPRMVEAIKKKLLDLRCKPLTDCTGTTSITPVFVSVAFGVLVSLYENERGFFFAVCMAKGYGFDKTL